MTAGVRALGVAAAVLVTAACATVRLDGPPPAQPAIAAPAATAPVSTDAAVEALLLLHHRPGAAAAVTRNGVIVWHHAYGLADVEAGTPVTDATIFSACSLSKPVTLVAIMQVVETLARDRGMTVSEVLDENIEGLVASDSARPLSFRNPAHPDVPITLRMLLTHTSGIHDTYARVPHHQEVSAPAYAFAGPSLRDAVTAFVTPTGRYFTKKSFGAATPGAHPDYSSIGTAAAALVADAHAEGGLAAYTRSSLFGPLGMESTAWRLAELGPSRALPLAVPYVSREARGGPPAERFRPAISEQTFWPGASLKTTALDYARFVAALADGQLLAPTTMAEVLRVQSPAVDPNRGLILAWSTRAGVRVVFHDGQNDGFRSTMFFTPRGTTVDGAVYGVVVLTNGDATVGGVPLEAKLGSELLARAMNGTLLPR